jgi:hypothetical protein
MADAGVGDEQIAGSESLAQAADGSDDFLSRGDIGGFEFCGAPGAADLIGQLTKGLTPPGD